MVGLGLLLLPGFGRAVEDGLAVPASPRYVRASGPVATHRFWSAKNWFPLNLTPGGGAYTMFAEPLAVQTTAGGLLVGYSPRMNVSRDFYVHPVQPDFTIGTPGLAAKAVYVASATDRMVTFDYGTMRVRVGRGMPFVYAETGSGEAVTVRFVAPPQVFAREGNRIGVALGENRYGLFCPAEGAWTLTEKVYTCRLPAGRHYFSAALLPSERAFARFGRVAFAFPVETPVTWSYDQARSVVRTTFEVKTEIKEGADAGFLQALYPHQYGSLEGVSGCGSAGTGNGKGEKQILRCAQDDTQLAQGDTRKAQDDTHLAQDGGQSDAGYASARGPMRLFDGRRFTTVDTFHGVLPFLPLPAGFDKAAEVGLLHAVEREGNHFAPPDTYGKGKSLARMAQLLPLAGMTGAEDVRERVAGALRAEFGRWSAPGMRADSRFVYDERWGTLIGYPGSYGSNTQLNDHHFHYGYWLNAAAMLGLYDRSWIQSAGNRAFFDELAGDIAMDRPGDARYPMLRSFDAYAGHSWASGQSPFGDGENEESSSEAVNAWAGLILYATETGNRRLRDTAVWMYTLETNAARDYWFNDGPVKAFPAGFGRVQVSNVFDGKADAATWFGADPEFEHGIQFLPFTGASLYLGRNAAYVERNLREVMAASGGQIRTGGDRWPDLMELYEGFYAPERALEEWRRTAYVFDGETRAHELAWLSSMKALGKVDESVTADAPFYAVFRGASGRVHVAFNAGDEAVTVLFSDGVRLVVPGRSMSVDGRVVGR